MKAIWNNTVVADAQPQDLINIEGSWYFPPESVDQGYFKPNYRSENNEHRGVETYYDIVIDHDRCDMAAWCYHEPVDGSIESIGKDFTDYVAFSSHVEVTE